MTGNKARRRESETERERDLGREGEQHSGERKWRGLILTVGLLATCSKTFAPSVLVLKSFALIRFNLMLS
jgi:hypothetical protein